MKGKQLIGIQCLFNAFDGKRYTAIVSNYHKKQYEVCYYVPRSGICHRAILENLERLDFGDNPNNP